MKLHNIITVMLVTALMAVSCIYPFSPDVEGESGTFVVEGDILIGEMTVVKLSYSASLATPGLISCPSSATVWVEDDQGGRYEGEPFKYEYNTKAKFTGYKVDTRECDPSRQYRLCLINGDNGREYHSSWQRVCKAPVIDSLSYLADAPKDRLNITLSMHSQGESYFKWSYVEDWEYHSYYHAILVYTPPQISYGWSWKPSMGNGTLEYFQYPENNYFCWNHDESNEIMIFSTENQTEDRFVDLEFHPIDRHDIKIQYIYRIEVDLEPLTKDGYIYWDTVKHNSEYNGSLFAPNPSELIGNIRCQQDTTEMVLGYINAAQRAFKTRYVYYTDHHFYKDKTRHTEEEVEEITENQWYEYYNNGMLPFELGSLGDLSSSQWAPKRCVDCSLMGGTKRRPADWINNDI